MKKFISIFLMTIMCLFVTDTLTGLKAEAAEKAEQSGIAVSVSSDKEDYAAAEDAQISFSIRNTNETDLDGVNWALQLPDGLAAKSGSLSGENLRIRAGESYEGSVSVEIASPDTTEAVTDTAGTTTADGTTTAPAVKAGEQKSAIGIFGLIAAAAALAWIARKRSRKLFGILSVFFCAGMIAVSAPARILAADEDGISIEAEKTVKIDGTNYTIKLNVSADALQEAAAPSELYAWAEYSKEDKSIKVKWQAQEDATGYTVYDKADPETPLAEVKDRTEYVYLLDESTKAKYVFFVEAKTADGKQTVSNDVTLRRNSDGSYTFSDIDSDRDGLDDLDEINRKTDRLNPDTDGDGLKDGYEVNQGSTDPLTADTDENGTPDGEEDFDGDGIPTQQESLHRANPYSGDTDEDGFPDSYEIANGMDPANADQIVIDSEKAAELKDYTETDIEALNENEEYPLEIYYNDDKFIERINGIYTTDRIQNAQDALYSLYHIKSLLGMDDPAAELVFTKTVMNRWTVSYSFNQVYQGIEAEGRTVTISCLRDGKISSAFSGYLNADHFKNLDLKPTVTKQRLKEIVNSGSDNPVEIFSSDLCIRMNPEAVLVYRVETSLKTVWIDAHTGKTVYEMDNITAFRGTSVITQADDEQGNEQTISVKHETIDANDIFYLHNTAYKTSVYLLEDPFVVRNQGVGTDNYYYAYPDVIRDNGYCTYYEYTQKDYGSDAVTLPAPSLWDGQAISAYCNFREVRERYATKQYYGLDGHGGASALFVHANAAFKSLKTTNAGYGGASYDYMVFTDPINTEYSFATHRGVIGHEFGHSVVKHNVAQNVSLSSMFMKTVNEAYADIFGSWVLGQWMVEEPLRNIANPNKSDNPAKIWGAYYDPKFLNEHTNSTIISHAAYLLTSKYDYTLDDVFDLFYASLPSLSDSCTKFSHIRDAVIATARGMGFTNPELLEIYDVFGEVGVKRPTGSARIVVKEGDEHLEGVIVQISDFGNYRTKQTDQYGAADFSTIQIGTNRVEIKPEGREPIYTTIMIREGEQALRIIDLLTAETDYEWDRYDHYNFDQEIGPTLDHHIEIKDTDITMRGYTEVPFKDFLLTHENASSDSSVHWARKILSFNIDRDEADWHTLEGGGFLFDVTITPPAEETGSVDTEAEDTGESTDEDKAGSEGFLTAHCVLVTSGGLKLYELRDVDIALFRDGKLGNINWVGNQLGNYAYDIGDVTAEHSISINVRKGSMETITILDGYDIIVENLEVAKLDGDDYGPITSHDSHWCEQESWFTFSDIQMSNVY